MSVFHVLDKIRVLRTEQLSVISSSDACAIAHVFM